MAEEEGKVVVVRKGEEEVPSEERAEEGSMKRVEMDDDDASEGSTNRLDVLDVSWRGSGASQNDGGTDTVDEGLEMGRGQVSVLEARWHGCGAATDTVDDVSQNDVGTDTVEDVERIPVPV